MINRLTLNLMNTLLITDILLPISILSAGVIYGTDMFHAVAGKKATAMSKDSSIADVYGHTHYIADQRMPFIGITGLVSTALMTAINYTHTSVAILSGFALLMLLAHLALYMILAKPINKMMSEAALKNVVPDDIRILQQKWESAIYYRAGILSMAMLSLIMAAMR
ncbi:hypothetical protein [Mucilaginibacter sp. HD30]